MHLKLGRHLKPYICTLCVHNVVVYNCLKSFHNIISELKDFAVCGMNNKKWSDITEMQNDSLKIKS